MDAFKCRRTNQDHRFYFGDQKLTNTESIQDDVNVYLDELRETGSTNMFGAGSYIQDEFDVDRKESHKLLAEWMRTFEERHKEDQA